MPFQGLIKGILDIGRQLILKEMATDAGRIDAFGLLILVVLTFIFFVTGAPLIETDDFRLDGTLPLLGILLVYPLISMLMIPPKPPNR